MVRYREWLREKRLTAHVEFVTAFFHVTRQAVVLAGSNWHEADSDAKHRFEESWERFAQTRAQVSLLATAQTVTAAQECTRLITDDLWPGRRRLNREEIGELQWRGLQLEQAFIRAAEREMGSRLLRRRR